jgi:UDP-GlcNAc3NAcA epimerase
MIQVVNIVGARPQFIKYFPVSQAMERHNQTIKTGIRDILVHTGQHYDYLMSKVFFDEFGIKEPDYHLKVGSGAHGKQTGAILERAEALLTELKPEVVMVYGDTNSTLGAALAAAKLHIPVMHIEAGLRSFSKKMPEEINRVLTDHLSTWLVCPSRTAVGNLEREGFSRFFHKGDLVPSDYVWGDGVEGSDTTSDNPLVLNMGDIMYDVLLYAKELADNKATVLERLDLRASAYYLLTLHRAENTETPEQVAEIIKFVNGISQGQPVIFPIHPRTKEVLKHSPMKFADNIRIIEPVGYFDMVALLKNSSLLLTDSGGLQKEAYWLKVPCVTLRAETEWIESIESGWNMLYKNYRHAHSPRATEVEAYGDGEAGARIINLINCISQCR